MRVLFAVLALSLVACGGSDTEAEATWETHTTAEDDGAGGEETAEPAAEPTDDPVDEPTDDAATE